MIELEFWHWWVIGVVLMIVEALTPASFFIWIGIGAIITGVIALIVPTLTFKVTGVIFTILSIISAYIGRSYIKKHQIKTKYPDLSRRGDQMVGKTFALVKPIENGVGKIKVGDTEWRVSGEDLSAGSKVLVKSLDGATLKVEKAANTD